MILKTHEGFKDSSFEPIMLIITKEEKNMIAKMSDDMMMIAFYPKNRGYTQELITDWMREGIRVETPPQTAAERLVVMDTPTIKQEAPDDGPNKV